MPNQFSIKSIKALFVGCILIMLWFYYQGYNSSIGWEVTTSAEVIEYSALEFKGNIIDFKIPGEKYLLTESYTGGPITRNRIAEGIFFLSCWIGLCIVLAASSSLSRLGFLLSMALFTLLINRLNLGEIGLFGINSKMSLLIPFISFVLPLVYFHEYRSKTPFSIRLLALIVVSGILFSYGSENKILFLDHIIAHSHFSLALIGLIFLLLIA